MGSAFMFWECQSFGGLGQHYSRVRAWLRLDFGCLAQRSIIFFNVQPQAEIMGSIGALALVANFLSVAILLKYRDCDSNVRSVWLFSRNDVLAAKKIVYPLELPQIEACVNL
jgi:hypothetical protein